jgi:hypothetical protein
LKTADVLVQRCRLWCGVGVSCWGVSVIASWSAWTRPAPASRSGNFSLQTQHYSVDSKLRSIRNITRNFEYNFALWQNTLFTLVIYSQVLHNTVDSLEYINFDEGRLFRLTVCSMQRKNILLTTSPYTVHYWLTLLRYY